jgi:hypothetical protein
MAEENENIAPRADQGSKSDRQPKKWWQWILVYPGLAIAIIASVPTLGGVIKSISMGVSFTRVYDAEEQHRLFCENYDCIQKEPFTIIKNKFNVEIGSLVCESGDVLITGKRPEWDKPQYRWVSLESIAPSNRLNKANNLLEVFTVAYAIAVDSLFLVQAPPISVICQRWVGNGLLFQRISTSAGCFDQVINTYTGLVVSSNPAQCSPNC